MVHLVLHFPRIHTTHFQFPVQYLLQLQYTFQNDGARCTGIFECCPLWEVHTIDFLLSSPFIEIRGFLDERRLLGSSKKWPETMLYVHVQKYLLESVEYSPVFLQLKKRRCVASLTIAKLHPLLHIHDNGKSFQHLHVNIPTQV